MAIALEDGVGVAVGVCACPADQHGHPAVMPAPGWLVVLNVAAVVCVQTN